MCGVAGFLTKPNKDSSFDYMQILKKMSDVIIHRGPDDSGKWFSKEDGIALAHRRLSILDISKAGHQPMESKTSRYVISYNGEVYNHLEIRKEIEELDNSITWIGHSDTETILAAFETFGIDKSLSKFTGMFAFAVWDKKNKILTLARDRVGEKPLYYGFQKSCLGQSIIFGSELKALKQFPNFNSKVDRGSLNLYLKFGYIPNPYSIYEGIFSLEPGSFIEITADHKILKHSKYWDACKIIKKASKNRFSGSPEEAVKELENLAISTIKSQMISDVPLGAFLSGGIDSSTIVSLMQSQSMTPIKTFTIGFNEKGFDEATYAKSIASHLGTDHTEMYVTASDAMKVIPEMPSIFSEPFADPSQIPNYIVSKLASQQVKVSLSGDAGDELFAGYSRYSHVENLWNKISFMPLSLRKKISSSIKSVVGSSLYANHSKQKINDIKRRLVSGSDVLSYESIDSLYAHVITGIGHSEEVVINSNHKQTKIDVLKPNFGLTNPIESMMATDMVNYLPDDILTKVDRSSMMASLESRVPFLDHKIIEFAWSLPLSYKVKDGISKWPLHQVLKKYVPERFTKRNKMGFSVPVHDWLRGPLKDWSESLLNADRLKKEGYFNESIVSKKWQEHLEYSKNNISFLWPILMFQAWLDEE